MVAYGNTKQSGDTYTCQHGAGECESDALELCTQYLLSGDMNSIQTGATSMQAWPFILCMEEAEGDPSKGSACFDSSNMASASAAGSNSTALTFDAVSNCASADFNDVQTAAMKATPTDHQYVPWVLVNSELVDNTNALVKAICDAYTGPTPKSCKRLSEDTPERCYNN